MMIIGCNLHVEGVPGGVTPARRTKKFVFVTSKA